MTLTFIHTHTQSEQLFKVIKPILSFFPFKIFIWLSWVLVAAHRLSNYSVPAYLPCSMWGLSSLTKD